MWSDPEKDSPAEARYPSGKGEVCKTFMRRFDPGPRLQSFQEHTLKRFSTWLLFGCQLDDNPLRNSLIRDLQGGRLSAKTPAERRSCHVRRRIEDVCIELEKDVGAGVP